MYSTFKSGATNWIWWAMAFTFLAFTSRWAARFGSKLASAVVRFLHATSVIYNLTNDKLVKMISLEEFVLARTGVFVCKIWHLLWIRAKYHNYQNHKLDLHCSKNHWYILPRQQNRVPQTCNKSEMFLLHNMCYLCCMSKILECNK